MSRPYRSSSSTGELAVALAIFIAAGGLVALANWLWALTTSAHARSFLVTLLLLGGLSGALTGFLLWGARRLTRLAGRGRRPAHAGWFFLAAAITGLPLGWGAASLALLLQAGGASRVWLAALALLTLVAYGLLSSWAGRLLEDLAHRAGELGLPSPGRTARRLGLSAAVVLMATLAVYLSTGRGLVRRTLAEKPAPTAELPNLILVSLDTLRPDHISSLGYSRPTTPRLDAILRRGAVFTDSVASSSWTILSHATLLTGASPSRIGPSLLQSAASGALFVPPEARTLAEVLHDNGYRTAAFIGGATVSASFGFDQGFEYFDDLMAPSIQSVTDVLFLGMATRTLLGISRNDFLDSFGPLLVATNNLVQGQGHRPMSRSFLAHAAFPRRFSNSAEEINHKVRSYLDGADLSRPQFLFVHYFDPHDPFDAPEPFGGRWAGPDRGLGYILDNGLVQRVMEDGIPLTQAEREQLLALYDENITVLDAGVEALMDLLEERGLLDGAIIAFFSDHGESFGEHDRLFHGHSLSEELIRNLFAVQYAGRIEPGLRLGGQVAAVDIMPTLLDLAGIRSEGRIGDGEGRSLAPLLSGESPAVEAARPAFSELYSGSIRETAFGTFQRDHLSVRHEGWKLVTDSTGSLHLYHLASDPEELIDLAGAEPERAADLQAMLERWRAGGYKKSDTEGESDQRRLEELKGLGYVSP